MAAHKTDHITRFMPRRHFAFIALRLLYRVHMERLENAGYFLILQQREDV